jgi:NodT family efflux transporter outer membrane factor (OMF) lipoprotein
MGPNFQRPLTVADGQALFLNNDNNATKKQSPLKWWERLNDPLLNEYVGILLKDNLSLKEAGERIIQAREKLNIQQGGFFPSLSASGGTTRSFYPLNSTGSSSANGSNNRIYSSNVSADLTTSWQLDLFGRIRRSVESSEAVFVASYYDKQALEHSLIAELLKLRIAISINTHLLKLAEETSENQNVIFSIVKRRYNLGTKGTILSDVYLSEENYTSLQADIYKFKRLITDDLYKLDVLLGKKPGFTKANTEHFSLLPPPIDIAIGIPASLLDNRPDLLASEFRTLAANSNIGVAIADLYPSVTIGGSLGFSGDGSVELFTSDQLTGSLLSNITTRLFEGGSLRANIRVKESLTRELIASYTKKVLEALREVETALKSEKEFISELKYKKLSYTLLKQAEEFTESRYFKGVERLKNYLEIKQRRYHVEQNWLRSQQEKWNNRIHLYLALGGDWLEQESNKDEV